jgi:hypothetical protein
LNSDPDQAIVTFDFGNIGQEDRPFNEIMGTALNY